MGMARGNDPYKIKRPTRSYGVNWCPDCSAEFNGDSDNWCKVVAISRGTETPRYTKVGDIPRGVCISCGSKKVKGPVWETLKVNKS